MKFTLAVSVLILFFFSTSLIQAQNQTDQQGRKHDEWRAYDERGNLRYTGQFRNGIPFGEFKYYYKDGSVKAISEFSNNGRETFTRAFHENGNLMAEGKYLDQKKDSTWNYYSRWDENLLISREYYKNTKKDSVWVNFFPDGDTAEMFRYENDLKQGTWLQFFENGSKKLEGNFENGELEGKMKAFYLDGGIHIEGSYHNGMKEETWLYYTPEGEIAKEEFYSNGHLMFSETYIEQEIEVQPSDTTQIKLFDQK